MTFAVEVMRELCARPVRQAVRRVVRGARQRHLGKVARHRQPTPRGVVRVAQLAQGPEMVTQSARVPTSHCGGEAHRRACERNSRTTVGQRRVDGVPGTSRRSLGRRKRAVALNAARYPGAPQKYHQPAKSPESWRPSWRRHSRYPRHHPQSAFVPSRAVTKGVIRQSWRRGSAVVVIQASSLPGPAGSDDAEFASRFRRLRSNLQSDDCE